MNNSKLDQSLWVARPLGFSFNRLPSENARIRVAIGNLDLDSHRSDQYGPRIAAIQSKHSNLRVSGPYEASTTQFISMRESIRDWVAPFAWLNRDQACLALEVSAFVDEPGAPRRRVQATGFATIDVMDVMPGQRRSITVEGSAGQILVEVVRIGAFSFPDELVAMSLGDRSVLVRSFISQRETVSRLRIAIDEAQLEDVEVRFGWMAERLAQRNFGRFKQLRHAVELMQGTRAGQDLQLAFNQQVRSASHCKYIGRDAPNQPVAALPDHRRLLFAETTLIECHAAATPQLAIA